MRFRLILKLGLNQVSYKRVRKSSSLFNYSVSKLRETTETRCHSHGSYVGRFYCCSFWGNNLWIVTILMSYCESSFSSPIGDMHFFLKVIFLTRLFSSSTRSALVSNTVLSHSLISLGCKEKLSTFDSCRVVLDVD